MFLQTQVSDSNFVCHTRKHTRTGRSAALPAGMPSQHTMLCVGYVLTQQLYTVQS